MDNYIIDISVIIPTFNRSEFIIDAVNSVVKQTYYEYIKEIIVVDDGGTDDTEIVLKENFDDPKIKYYWKKNGGVSTARNYGVKMARGNWIALLDSDDEWNPDKIQQQVTIIKEHPEIDALGTGYNHTKLRIGGKTIDRLYNIKYFDLFLKFFPTTPLVIIKRSVFQEIGGFNESQRYCEDNAFFLDLAYSYNFYYLPESLVRCGHDKSEYGESGLSANMKEMQKGALQNLKDQYDKYRINKITYMILYVYHSLKYIRRLIIKVKRIKNRKVN